MNNKNYYTKKIPDGSEFNVSNYLAGVLIFAVMTFVYLLKFYPDLEILVAFIIVFIYIQLAGRIKAMKYILIRKIESTIEENSEISKKCSHLGFYLISDSKVRDSFYKEEGRYFRYGIALFFMLYVTASILGVSSKNYLVIVYICLWQTVFAHKRLNDVFKYFQDIKEECMEKISSKEELLTLSKNLSEQIKYFQKIQWYNINKIGIISSLVFIVVFSMIFDFKPFPFLVIVASGGLTLLAINTIFLNKQINGYLPLLREYDEYLKEQIGLVYKPDDTNKDYEEIAKELNQDIKDIFR